MLTSRLLTMYYLSLAVILIIYVGNTESSIIKNNEIANHQDASNHTSGVKTLKSLLDIFNHDGQKSAGNFSLEGLRSSLANNSLAYLLSLGNETNYLNNLTALTGLFNNRTGRSGYGGWGGGGGGYGGGWGGGIDPALLLLLKDDKGWGWGGWGQQQQGSSSSSGMSDFGQLGLLTLLGLALISRLPTQG